MKYSRIQGLKRIALYNTGSKTLRYKSYIRITRLQDRLVPVKQLHKMGMIKYMKTINSINENGYRYSYPVLICKPLSESVPRSKSSLRKRAIYESYVSNVPKE